MLLEPRHDRPMPRMASNWMMGLLMISLFILFLAGALVYGIVRNKWATPTGETPAPLPWGSLQPPWLLMGSTGLLLLSGVSLHLGVVAVRREDQRSFRRFLTLSLALALAFLAVQIPAAAQWLSGHFETVSAFRDDRSTGAHAPTRSRHALAGAAVFLVGLHALHVVVGLGYFSVILRRTFHGHFDHEFHLPVRMLGWYWHFLEAVWLILLGMFFFLR